MFLLVYAAILLSARRMGTKVLNSGQMFLMFAQMDLLVVMLVFGILAGIFDW